MDWFVPWLFEKIFPPPAGAKPRQPFFTSAPEVRGMRAERRVRRYEHPPTGEPDVPEEPLDTAEFAMPAFPFKQPSASGEVAPQPIQSPSPTAMPSVPLQVTMPSDPPQTTAPTVPPPTTRPAKSAADRIYRRNLMGLAAAIMNRMAESDVMAHELAAQAGCSTDTINMLLTGKTDGLTLDGLEGIAEKLGMVLVVQMRLFGPTTGPQPKP